MVPGMGTDVLIRRAQANDAEAVANVFLASRATMTYLPQLHTEADTRAFIARVVNELETFVALDNGNVAGFMALRNDWLDHLYVRPKHFSRGMGSLLLEEAKRRRPDGFQFWVFQQNERARRFYERHGCIAAEFTDGSGNEERLPDIRYEWRSI